MNKLIPLFLLLFLSTTSQAANTAVPVQQIIKETLDAQYSYAGHALTFGFNSIESCLWKSKDIIILHNYCFPKKNYPARGFTIWSKKFGIINFYEEILSGGPIKKDITISQFPEAVRDILPDDLSELDFTAINSISEKLYYRWNAACWSTNYDWYTKDRVANCVKAEIADYLAWAQETQAVVNSSVNWNAILSTLLEKVKQP